jgi:hypothetical protein
MSTPEEDIRILADGHNKRLAELIEEETGHKIVWPFPKEEWQNKMKSCTDPESLEKIRTRIFGKKGVFKAYELYLKKMSIGYPDDT